MSNVLLGFVVLVMMVGVLLLVFIVAFGGALLVFGRKDKKGDEKPRVLAQRQQVGEQETV